MSSARKLVPAVAAFAAAAVTVSFGAGSAGASTSHPAAPHAAVPAAPTVLPTVIPGWLHSAKVVGATPANDEVYVTFALIGKDPVGERAYGVAASTPGNALYRHWLTKEQFAQRFGPDASAAPAVTAALKALGITNVMTDALGTSVLAGIPASVAGPLFGVRFEQVMHGGLSTRVAMNEPTLPASLVPLVSDVAGLTQERVHLEHETKVPATAPAAPPTPPLPVGGAPTGYFNANPTSTSYASNLATTTPPYPVLSGDSSTTKPYTTSGYTPPQIRGAYDVTKVTQTGKGVTAGVVLFYSGPDVGADLATFSTAFNLAAPNYTDLTAANQGITTGAGSAPVISPADAAGEQTLDVEAIHQMAPDAAIVYSGAVAPEDGPIYVAEDTAIAGGAQVINNSYGGTGDTDAANATAFQTAVTGPAMTMGVGLDYSSGDSGDDVTANAQREADFPTTSDEVTSVGGTGIEIGAKNDYQGEFYWGTYSTGAPLGATDKSWGPVASQSGGAGGGGGLSTAFAEPTWQKGVVPDEETVNADTAAGYNTANGSDPTYGVTGAPGRVVPDVAMIADSTTGLLVGETQAPDATGTAAAPTANTAGTTAYSYYRIGGTSVSSPIFTGMMALVDQALTDKAGATTSAGFVNPTIYPFEAKHDGSFRDPQVGRAPTASRLGGTVAQSLTGCTTAAPDVCTGTGPGVVPVVAEVRSDYTDTANDGIAVVSDPGGLGTHTGGTATPGNPVLTHLRTQGNLGTLEDLPGFDDSTGLGSPDAPQFIADFLGASVVTTPPATLPETSAPVLFVVIGALGAGLAVTLRRRRRYDTV